MPASKAPSLRQIVVDKCLSGEREMTSTEIMNAVNAYMLSHGLPMVTSKNTIMDDIDIISMAWNVEVSKTTRGKYVYYHYKDPLFSIHKPKIRTEDLEKINETIKALKKYVGLPQCAWVENVNAILHAYAYDNNDERPIVTFSHNPEYADNLKHFTPLYDFIKSKSAIVLKYKKFNCEDVTTRILHPYQLNVFLAEQQPGHCVHVLFIIAHHSDARNVQYLPFDTVYIVKRVLYTIPHSLFKNALKRLEP